HEEMIVLFKMDNDELRQHFAATPRRIELELSKMADFHSAKSYLVGKDYSELDLTLPEGLLDMAGGRSWHRFLIDHMNSLAATFEAREVSEFIGLLSKYREFSVGLNYAADAKLLKGLDAISTRLDQVRSGLSVKKSR